MSEYVLTPAHQVLVEALAPAQPQPQAAYGEAFTHAAQLLPCAGLAVFVPAAWFVYHHHQEEPPFHHTLQELQPPHHQVAVIVSKTELPHAPDVTSALVGVHHNHTTIEYVWAVHQNQVQANKPHAHHPQALLVPQPAQPQAKTI